MGWDMTATNADATRRYGWRIALSVCAVAAVATSAAARAGQGLGQSKAAAAARQSRRPKTAGQGIVRPARDRGAVGGALARLLCQRLPCRRRRGADQRPDLAGDAAVAQPQLGPSGPGALPGELSEKGTSRLARPPGRRHLAAARRPDADRPCQPSGRPRRRHLVHADARPRTDPPASARKCRRPWWWRRTARTSTRRSGRRRTPPSSRRQPKDPEVERVFVNPAIKKALCRYNGPDRTWLRKVRPIWGHDYHFHIRMRCPADSPDCRPQDPRAGRRRLRQRARRLVQEVFEPRPKPKNPKNPRPSPSRNRS